MLRVVGSPTTWSRRALTGWIAPGYPADWRFRIRLPAGLITSSEAPSTAMDRGTNRASRCSVVLGEDCVVIVALRPWRGAEDRADLAREVPAIAVHERDLGARDLRRRVASQLPDRFGHQEEAVHARMRVGETTAVGVHREVPARRDAAVLHVVAAFALLAEAEVLEEEDHVDRERVVQLGHVDVVGPEPGHGERPSAGVHRGRGGEVGHLRDLAVPVRLAHTEHERRRTWQVERPLGRGDDDGGAAVGDEARIAHGERRRERPTRR